MTAERDCEWCGRAFRPGRRGQRFGSPLCRYAAHNARERRSTRFPRGARTDPTFGPVEACREAHSHV